MNKDHFYGKKNSLLRSRHNNNINIYKMRTRSSYSQPVTLLIRNIQKSYDSRVMSVNICSFARAAILPTNDMFCIFVSSMRDLVQFMMSRKKICFLDPLKKISC